MKIVKTVNELKTLITRLKEEKKTIGLVPTMGALHEGHISLITHLRPQVDILVCSIFVNPTQFNDPEDLIKYPRPIENDIQLLTKNNCDVLFLPSVEEIYPADEPDWHLDLGDLENIWEGEHRPGHFQGVTQIVYKLFENVQPNIACFGQKDFQQVMVIQKLIELKSLPIQLSICPTLRNEEGLALSSRNKRLSTKGLHDAAEIYKALQYAQQNIKVKTPQQLTHDVKEMLEHNPAIKVEYVAICETKSLQAVNEINPAKKHVILIALWLEGVRLIDNLLLI